MPRMLHLVKQVSASIAELLWLAVEMTVKSGLNHGSGQG